MFESILTTPLTMEGALWCTLASLVLGGLVAGVYWLQSKNEGGGSPSLFMTLLFLPALVQVVIMLVNGNLGAGVAVMGAFGLVRFRSVPGTGRDILYIFYAMAIGLATGMGYLMYAFVFAIVLGVIMVAVMRTPMMRRAHGGKRLQIAIPEDLDYTDCFADIFQQYTTSAELENVKSTNMGTMFQLTYTVHLRDAAQEKAMLDAIRCRNGNLTVQCGNLPAQMEML
jgi:uncharacterized membrane protein YhiD involved in acid resistance